MSDSLRLQVCTNRRKVIDTYATAITLPGIQGELGILPNHAPLMTTLSSGLVKYQKDGKTYKIAAHYGFLQVYGDTVSVLVKMAELPDQIDFDRVRRSQDRSSSKLQSVSAPGNYDSASVEVLNQKLRRAMIRMQLS